MLLALRQREIHGSLPQASTRGTNINGYRAILGGFETSTMDTYTLWIDEMSNAVPPFALSYSDGGHQLAIGDEEGFVTVLNTSKDGWNEDLAAKLMFCVHMNAIFDVHWMRDDSVIATASGDSTVKLFDVNTQQALAVFKAHTGSVKTVRSMPSNPNIVASASRDGSALLWDLRINNYSMDNGAGRNQPGQTYGFNQELAGVAGEFPFIRSPALAIHDAHVRRNTLYSESESRKRRRQESSSKLAGAPKSVTSLAFVPCDPNVLFTAGAADGSMKVWDIRTLSLENMKSSSCAEKSKCNKAAQVGKSKQVQNTPLLSVVPSISACQYGNPSIYSDQRVFGISNLDVDSTGKYVLAGCMNSTIYIYHAQAPDANPAFTLQGHVNSSSFYIRSRFSPDGKTVISGSSDSKAYLWHLADHVDGSVIQPCVALVGHSGGEVSDVAWCKVDPTKLATCGDDRSVKVWRVNRNLKMKTTVGSRLGAANSTTASRLRDGERREMLMIDDSPQTNTENERESVEHGSHPNNLMNRAVLLEHPETKPVLLAPPAQNGLVQGRVVPTVPDQPHCRTGTLQDSATTASSSSRRVLKELRITDYFSRTTTVATSGSDASKRSKYAHVKTSPQTAVAPDLASSV